MGRLWQAARTHREQVGVLLDHELSDALQRIDLRARRLPCQWQASGRGYERLQQSCRAFAFASVANLASFSSVTAWSCVEDMAASTSAGPFSRYAAI